MKRKIDDEKPSPIFRVYSTIRETVMSILEDLSYSLGSFSFYEQLTSPGLTIRQQMIMVM